MAEKDPLRALPMKERTELVRLLQQYLHDHFDLDAGDLGAELLLSRNWLAPSTGTGPCRKPRP